ncbi:hypothetical protein DER44DRAFT_744977 [Fusarium oxysporum]|nr:hypothetical protein DER44DRAFT_744977 [Fusarium oxysporum]
MSALLSLITSLNLFIDLLLYKSFLKLILAFIFNNNSHNPYNLILELIFIHFLASEKTDLFLSNYIDSINKGENPEENEIEEEFSRPFLRNEFRPAKKEGTLPSNFNKTIIPLGLLYIYQLFKNLFSLKQSFQEESGENSIFIEAINIGLKKLQKYFPLRLNTINLKDYQFKLRHFEQGGLLYHYPTIKDDVKDLFIREFEKAPEGSLDELQNPHFIRNNKENDLDSDSDQDLYPSFTSEVEEYELYLKEQNCHPKAQKDIQLKRWMEDIIENEGNEEESEDNSEERVEIEVSDDTESSF